MGLPPECLCHLRRPDRRDLGVERLWRYVRRSRSTRKKPMEFERLCLVLAESRRNFVGTHGTDGPFSRCCVVLVYEEILRACRGVPGGGAPEKGAQMRQLIAIAVFVLCFGVGTAHAQKTGGSNNVAGGGGVGPFEFGWRRRGRRWRFWRGRRFGGWQLHAPCGVGASRKCERDERRSIPSVYLPEL